MKKSQKILASLAAVGALCIGSAAVAAPWHHGDCPMADVPPSMQAPQRGATAFAEGYPALANVLTLTDAQKPLWKAYMDARAALRDLPRARWDQPAVDVQERLERRAQVAEARAAAAKKVAETRAELIKSFSVEQKYVLESFESVHRGMPARPLPPGPKGRPHDLPMPPCMR